MSFTKKRIRVEVYLKARKFEDGSDVVKIEGNPVSVTITKQSIPSMNEASITIWGLSLEKMRALTMVGYSALQLVRNRVKIFAGDGEDLPLVFVGDQTSGVVSFNDSGEASIELKAFTSVFASQTPASPVAVEGTSKASDLIAQFATEAGFGFVNQGVTASVKDTVISGDPMTKMRSVANQVGAHLIIDDQTVTLLPKGKPLDIPSDVLSKENGLIGYPQVTSRGVTVRCLFRPELRFGQTVKVKSVVPLASGEHRIIKLTHNIDAFKNEGGSWFTTFESYFNYGL